MATCGGSPIWRRLSAGRSGGDPRRCRFPPDGMICRRGNSVEAAGYEAPGESGEHEVRTDLRTHQPSPGGSLVVGFVGLWRPTGVCGGSRACVTHIAKCVTVPGFPLTATGGPKIPGFFFRGRKIPGAVGKRPEKQSCVRGDARRRFLFSGSSIAKMQRVRRNRNVERICLLHRS